MALGPASARGSSSRSAPSRLVPTAKSSSLPKLQVSPASVGGDDKLNAWNLRTEPARLSSQSVLAITTKHGKRPLPGRGDGPCWGSSAHIFHISPATLLCLHPVWNRQDHSLSGSSVSPHVSLLPGAPLQWRWLEADILEGEAGPWVW